MKKFLSVLLTMAMVMSLFTGTVLAAGANAPSTSFTITAGTASYEYNLKTFGLADDKVSYTITGAAGTYNSPQITVPATGIVSINTANLSIATGNVSETYSLVFTNTVARDHDDDVTTPAQPTLNVTVTVLHIMTVNGSTSNPTVAANSNNVFNGTLLTSANRAVAGEYIEIWNNTAPGSLVASAITGPDGSFVINAYIGAAGSYSIRVGAANIVYKSLRFEPIADLKITPDSNNQASLRASTNNEETYKFAIAPVTGAPTFTNTNTLVNVTMPNGTVLKTTYVAGTSTYDVKLENVANDNADDPSVENWIAGTYTVEVVQYVNTPAASGLISDSTGKMPVRTGTTTFTVVDNTSAIFFKAAQIGGANGTSSTPVAVNVPGATSAINLQLVAAGSKTFDKVTYTVSGPLKEEVTITKLGIANVAYNSTLATDLVSVTGGGTITLKGTATYTDKTTEEFTKTFVVRGYVVEFAPETLGHVGDEITLSAVVTTPAGVPVNNATVTWTAVDYNGAPLLDAFKVWKASTSEYIAVNTSNGDAKVNGQASVVQNGTYTYKVKLMKPAVITTTVTGYEAGAATYSWKVQPVYGAEVYTATATGTLVATVASQKLTVKLFDASGVVITPGDIRLDDSNGVLAETAAANFVSVALVSGQITLNPLKTGTFNLLVTNTDGTKIAVVPVTVVAPIIKSVTVVGKDSLNVTAGFVEKVIVTFENLTSGDVTFVNTNVIDANTGSAGAAGDTGIYATSAAATTVGAVDINTVSFTNKVAEFYVNTYVNRDAAGKIDIKVKGNLAASNPVVATTLQVKPISIDTNGVTALVVDSNEDLQLTVTDARGNALEGVVVQSNNTLAGNNTATTDANGKAVLSVKPVTVGTMELSVANKQSYYYKNTAGANILTNALTVLTIGRDVTGPVVEVEDVYTVNTSSATVSFTVSDTSKIAEVWVGDVKALVRPDNTVRFVATGLVPGVNEFEVLAYDVEGNGTIATLVVEYLKPATVLLTIGSTDATKDGAAMTGMDQAPMIVNGRTFLPVRFVLVNLLGGTIEWDANTQTITSVVNGNTIKMVIGSNTAYVNGNAVALLEAPYIEATTGRTLVPMREIMEAIGVSLDWNGATQTVTITIPQ